MNAENSKMSSSLEKKCVGKIQLKIYWAYFELKCKRNENFVNF